MGHPPVHLTAILSHILMNHSPGQNVAFKVFRGMFASWESLFSDAADFASRLKPGQLISISHSADHSDGVVVVWYWSAS